MSLIHQVSKQTRWISGLEMLSYKTASKMVESFILFIYYMPITSHKERTLVNFTIGLTIIMD